MAKGDGFDLANKRARHFAGDGTQSSSRSLRSQDRADSHSP